MPSGQRLLGMTLITVRGVSESVSGALLLLFARAANPFRPGNLTGRCTTVGRLFVCPSEGVAGPVKLLHMARLAAGTNRKDALWDD